MGLRRVASGSMGSPRALHGFTLIEILVVIGIIVILAGILLPAYFRLSTRQGQNTCINNLREIGAALAMYREDYGGYPVAPSAAYLQSAATNTTAPNPLYMPVTAAASATPTVSGIPAPVAADIIVTGTYTKDYPQLFTITITQSDPAPMWQWTDSELNLGNTIPPAQAVTTTPVALGATGITLTFASATGHTQGQQWRFWETPVKDNLGLASLYYLYLKDTKDYVKSIAAYHCPSQAATRTVDRGAVLNRFTDPGERSARYDPLWAGSNTYDVTYNYDQYNGVIQAYETAIGQPSLQSPRQLKNATPPHDAVVTWCYAHSTSKKPSFEVPALGSPVLPLTATNTDVSAKMREKSKDLGIVLWLDGTADIVHPTLARGVDGYYWTPPFLMSRGSAGGQ